MAYVEKIKVGSGEAWDLRDAEAHASIERIDETITGINNSVTSINNSLNSMSSLVSTIKLSIYPVGSIYMSVDSTSPNTLFGGTWERLKDRFLLAAGDTYSAGSTGGEAYHTLTVNEMPSHNHVGLYESTDNTLLNWKSGETNSVVSGSKVRGAAGDPDIYTGSTGGGQAHNNMPPYLVVYMWKRTA